MTEHSSSGQPGPTYRAREMREVAGWAAANISGAVVGLVGCGRSSFLRHLCDHPAALMGAGLGERVVLVPVDLYDLPSDTLADLYRTILHAFYWVRARLPPEPARAAAELYLEHRATTDPFISQKALYELILAFKEADFRVVLVMNRFDRFCETTSRQQVNTLRSLRDRFKETLSYIVGMRQEAAYLPDPSILGDMYELFDSHVCYIGALTHEDTRRILLNMFRAAPERPSEEELELIWRLSGGFPSLLKTIAEWWQLGGHPPARAEETLAALLDHGPIQYRLDRLWHGLTQEEKLLLNEIQRQQIAVRRSASQSWVDGSKLQRLAAKGCCVEDGSRWQINGELLAAFVGGITGRIHGRIWLDEAEGVVYQGRQPVEGLTPLELNILRFLIAHPRARHASDTIIEHAWPVEENKEAVTANNLQVHVSNIRKKIEPNSAAPRYLITWYGRPGGYQFFPEGKPE